MLPDQHQQRSNHQVSVVKEMVAEMAQDWELEPEPVVRVPDSEPVMALDSELEMDLAEDLEMVDEDHRHS